MIVLKHFLLIFSLSSLLSDMIALQLANKFRHDLDIVPDLSLSDEQFNDVYKILCRNLMNSEDWFALKHSAQQACLNLMIAEYKNKSSNKQRRFFALQVGKSLPNQNADSTSKGFKYGRK